MTVATDKELDEAEGKVKVLAGKWQEAESVLKAASKAYAKADEAFFRATGVHRLRTLSCEVEDLLSAAIAEEKANAAYNVAFAELSTGIATRW